MDPLSITVSCFTLVGTITKASVAVTGFVKDVRDARGDLDAISRELLSLKTVLELLADDTTDATDETIPHTLRKQILGIISNCDEVVVEIETSLKKHGDSKLGKAGYWTVGGGKGDMSKLRSSLEAHKSALELALDMVAITLAKANNTLAKDIKNDTEQTRGEVSAIKDDTAQILEEIARLQARLPLDAPRGDSNFMLQRYLDDLTSYAETVYDPFSVGRSPSMRSSISSRPPSPLREISGQLPETPMYNPSPTPKDAAPFPNVALGKPDAHPPPPPRPPKIIDPEYAGFSERLIDRMLPPPPPPPPPTQSPLNWISDGPDLPLSRETNIEAPPFQLPPVYSSQASPNTGTADLKTPTRNRSHDLSKERNTPQLMKKLTQKPVESSINARRKPKRITQENDGMKHQQRSTNLEEHIIQQKINSIPSGLFGTSTIQNPRLLATVEDAIKRLILPEINALKAEQKATTRGKSGGMSRGRTVPRAQVYFSPPLATDAGDVRATSESSVPVLARSGGEVTVTNADDHDRKRPPTERVYAPSKEHEDCSSFDDDDTLQSAALKSGHGSTTKPKSELDTASHTTLKRGYKQECGHFVFELPYCRDNLVFDISSRAGHSTADIQYPLSILRRGVHANLSSRIRYTAVACKLSELTRDDFQPWQVSFSLRGTIKLMIIIRHASVFLPPNLQGQRLKQTLDSIQKSLTYSSDHGVYGLEEMLIYLSASNYDPANDRYPGHDEIKLLWSSGAIPNAWEGRQETWVRMTNGDKALYRHFPREVQGRPVLCHIFESEGCIVRDENRSKNRNELQSRMLICFGGVLKPLVRNRSIPRIRPDQELMVEHIASMLKPDGCMVLDSGEEIGKKDIIGALSDFKKGRTPRTFAGMPVVYHEPRLDSMLTGRKTM